MRRRADACDLRCMDAAIHTLPIVGRHRNPLLEPGERAQREWARIAADEALQRPANETVEDRLRRGQRLSAQAGALRRAVRDDSRPARS